MKDFNTPAKLPSIPDIVKEYDAKVAAIPALCAEYKALHNKVDVGASMGGTYVGRSYDYHPSISERRIAANLLESAWRYVYTGLNIREIASASDRSQFDLSLKTPPEFTIDNISATFGQYLQDPRFHVLKGLAECFVDLDPAYKSHSKVKIGVKGLPKRIIIENCTSYGAWGYGRLNDTLNALRVFRGLPHIEHWELDDFLEVNKTDIDDLPEWDCLETYRGGNKVQHNGKIYKSNGHNRPSEDFTITNRMAHSGWRELVNTDPSLNLKQYQNGNAHLIFDKQAQHDINLALAEFYGETLPDMPDEDAVKRTGTNVSANLAYYPTPRAVIARICNRELDLRQDQKVLEPSCGDGQVMDYIREQNRDVSMVGVEYDAGRADEARAKGHRVQTANFLQVQPSPIFDLVIMNPPFNGTHWRKHLDHARKFVKPADADGRGAGRIICILPASAFYDGHLDDLLWTGRRHQEQWKDLPVASFADSGTNIPTGYFIL